MTDTEKVTVSVELREGYHLVALAKVWAVPLMTGIITSPRMRRRDWAAWPGSMTSLAHLTQAATGHALWEAPGVPRPSRSAASDAIG
jgi:hypothetical protein